MNTNQAEFEALVAAAPKWCHGLSDWETICKIHRLSVEDGQLFSGWPLARVQAIFSAMKAEKEAREAVEEAVYQARLAAKRAAAQPTPSADETASRESDWYRTATFEQYQDRGD